MGGPRISAQASDPDMGGTVRWLCHGSQHVLRSSPHRGNACCFRKPLPISAWSRTISSLAFQESPWEGDLTPVLSFCRNFSSATQVLRGGCRLDFTSTSVLFIFASLQYYQLLLHMDDPYCALVKWCHIMLLCLYHQTLLMKKSPGLPRFICSIYFSQTLFWIKHLR